MRRLRLALAVAGALWFAGAGGCVDVSWVAGVRCDGENCPAGLMCCNGRCYASCESTGEADAAGSGGAPGTGDAGNMSLDAGSGTVGIGGRGGFPFMGPGFGGNGAGNFYGPGPRGF